MTRTSIGKIRERRQLSLLVAVLAWAAFFLLSAPVVLADTQCPVALFPSIQVERASCPSTPSGSFCLFWQSAEGVFTPTHFSTQGGGLAIEGTFSGVAYAFSDFVYTLIEEPVWFFIDEPNVARSLVTIRGQRVENGPYVPEAEVQYTTQLHFEFVDENGPGVSIVEVDPLTLTAYPSSRFITWAFRRAGDDPVEQAEVLNQYLFNLTP